MRINSRFWYKPAQINWKTEEITHYNQVYWFILSIYKILSVIFSDDEVYIKQLSYILSFHFRHNGNMAKRLRFEVWTASPQKDQKARENVILARALQPPAVGGVGCFDSWIVINLFFQLLWNSLQLAII